MIMAVRLIRAQGSELTRDVLKPPFYSQSYAAAPFALALGGGALMLDAHWMSARAAGAAVVAAALIGYWLVQARWFGEHLRTSFLRGLGHASVGMVQATALLLIVTPLFR